MRQCPLISGTEAIAIWPKPEGWIALVTGRRFKLIRPETPVNWLNLSIFLGFWTCSFPTLSLVPHRIREPLGTFMMDHPYLLRCCMIISASFLVPGLAVHFAFQMVMNVIMDCIVALNRRTDSRMPYLLEEQLKELGRRVERKKRREMWGVTEHGKVVYGKWWLDHKDTKQEEV